MIVPVTLESQQRRIRANALLDSASSASYIRASLADELKLDGNAETVETTVLGGHVVSGQQQRVALKAQSTDGSFVPDLTAWTQPTITAPLKPVNWPTTKAKYKHLRNIPFPSLTTDRGY